MGNLLDWGTPTPATTEPVSEPAVTTAAVREPKGPRSGRINPGRRQGEHGTGSRAYTPADIQAVYHVLKGRIVQDPVSVAQIAVSSGLNGRTVRSILSERDGIDFLVGTAPNGMLWDCTADPVYGEGFSEKLRSQIIRMAERVRRRQTFMEASRLVDVMHANDHLSPGEQYDRLTEAMR